MISKILDKTLLPKLIYVPSEILEYDLNKMIEKEYGVTRETRLLVRTEEDLKESEDLMQVPPFWGGTWYMSVDMSEISIGEFVASVRKETKYGLKVYYVRDYKTYKRLLGLEVVKKGVIKFKAYYLGKLTRGCIEVLDTYYREKNGVSEYISRELRSYLWKVHNRDVRGICELYRLMESGEEVKTEKDIKELIGLGNNTIDKYVMSVLSLTYEDKTAMKIVLRNRVKLLTELRSNYSYDVIREVVTRKVDTLIEIKQLQIMGVVGIKGVELEIPKGYNEIGIMSMLKYEKQISEEISLEDVLKYKKLLEKYKRYESEQVLILSLLDYVILRRGKKKKGKKSKKKVEKKKEKKE